MIDFTNIARIIKENNTFLITTHINPDADAIGSETAFYLILKALGKKAYIINCSSTPDNLIFLDKDQVIQRFDEQIHQQLFDTVDVLVALDFNNPSRTGSMEKFFSASCKLKICIDHHQHPKAFVDHIISDPGYAATGHIIYDLIERTSIVPVTEDIAEALYAAIMTDTGSFKFDRTTPEVHRIAAVLLEAGVNPAEIHDKIFDQSRFGKVKLLGECLSNMTISSNKSIAYMVVTSKALQENQVEESEVDGFVNYCLSVQGVRIGMLFFEMKDGLKISFRSKGKMPVNMLAEEFGGGGHINAAGARLSGVNFFETVYTVVETAEKYLKIY